MRAGLGKELAVCALYTLLTTQKLRHPMLHGVTFLTLEDIIKRDERQTFHLLHDPRHLDFPATSSQEGSWWIRANRGRSPEASMLQAGKMTRLKAV